MKFYSNPNKNIEIEANGKVYFRHAIKTHFIKINESYIDIIKEYVTPIYQKNDILFISEKIISLCQNRVCYAKDIKISFWAKILSKFASSNFHGIGVDNPYKMQLAINLAGILKVLYAAIISAIFKLFGKKGLFYKIVGKGVSGIDGFYDKAFEYYGDKGILLPNNPEDVCNKIEDKLKINCVILDANDLGIEILGKSKNLAYSEDELKLIIKDNPAGQSTQQTPLILARQKYNLSLPEKISSSEQSNSEDFNIELSQSL